jgi:hypothetical protein
MRTPMKADQVRRKNQQIDRERQSRREQDSHRQEDIIIFV